MKVFITVGCLALLSFGSGAMGATAGRLVTVVGTLNDDTNYGGCMARVTPSPDTFAGVSCAATYVSMSCTGDFTSKTDANAKFSVAQLAYVTGASLYIIVDDTKKHNGYCYVRRMDILN